MKGSQRIGASGTTSLEHTHTGADKHARSAAEPLLTVAEVQVMLGLPSAHAVYRQIRQHGLPYYRYGGLYRFDLAEVKAWGKRHRGGQAEQAAHGQRTPVLAYPAARLRRA